MSTYKSIAVAGVGGIGATIVKALVDNGAQVTILSRPSSHASKSFPGTKTVPVDYTDVAAVTAALKENNVEVLLSTIGLAGHEIQYKLAEATKAAGGTLFVPSEYGMPTHGHTVGPLGHKDEFAHYLESIGLPWARFYVGFFTGQIPWLTGYAENGKINIAGKGGAVASWTAEEDIAGFIAHVLTHQPKEKLANKLFRLQGDRATLEEVAALFKAEAVYVDAVPGEGGDVKTFLQGALDAGFASTGWDPASGKEGPEPAGSTNDLWEGHHWKTIKEVHNL